MKNDFEKISKILEKNEFSCYEPTRQDDQFYLDFCQYTPAGEDWHVCLFYDGTFSNFSEELKNLVDNFDVDEEASIFIETRGTRGVPNSISELIKDAKWKLRTLKKLVKSFK